MQRKHGGNVYQLARAKGLDPEALIDFSASINPLGYAPRFRKSLASIEHTIVNYPDHSAHDFITTLADYHALPREYFLPGNGSTEFIYILPGIMRPKSVLIVAPAFTEYEQSYQRAKGVIFYFETREADGFAVDAGRLLDELRRGYSAVYFCNPASPTGVLTSPDVMQEVIRVARSKSTAVILDETFIDFTENHSMKALVTTHENLFVLRSLTKFFGLPGIRAGYLISSPHNIDRLRARQEPWSINALAQKAGTDSLLDSGYIHKTIQYVKEARKALAADLKRVPVLKLFPGAANFMLLKLLDSAPLSGPQLYDALLEKNIIIRTCEDFHGLDDSFIRLAVKRKNENKKLAAELKKLLSTR